AVLLERHVGKDGIASHSNTVTGLEVADNADVTWAIVQEEGANAVHLAQLNVTLGANSKLTILVLNAGGSLVRREINILAKGEGSTIAIKGVNLIGGKAHVDVTTALVHEAPGVGAQELFRNVATGEGRGVFQGQIRVAQIAQKTDAKMACNTLLLSDTAEFAAKPELEIFADDVACGHGATVTDILDEHLFYLRSRGIPLKQARAMLVQAFVEEVFDELEDETMRDALDARIERWLLNHG
nr:Fe-S cluster assembly protein SufD [Nitratireductor sp.]